MNRLINPAKLSLLALSLTLMVQAEASGQTVTVRGADGRDGNPGGDGGSVSAFNEDSPYPVNSSFAYGGRGGSFGAGRFSDDFGPPAPYDQYTLGGLGGSALAVTKSESASSVDVSAIATAAGGAGGGRDLTGNTGGAAKANAVAITRSAGQNAEATAYATGGAGGDNFGTKFFRPSRNGGNGGMASDSSAFAQTLDGAATASVYQTGGAGGAAGFDMAGGKGADSVLMNAVGGSTAGGSLVLNQAAIAGKGGDCEGCGDQYGAALGYHGEPGNAVSSLNTVDTGSQSVTANVSATGGNSGHSGGGFMVFYDNPGGNGAASVSVTGAHDVQANAYAQGGSGGTSGGWRGGPGSQGGFASASAEAVTTGMTDHASAKATAYGGLGGNGGGPSALEWGNGGNGGIVNSTSATAAARAGTATASVEQLGGNGGFSPNQRGGDGANSQLVNAVNGSTVGGTLVLSQHAQGGNGGSGGWEGGRGGDSVSSLTTAGNGSQTLKATASSTGGSGGRGFPTGQGGDASAFLTVDAADTHTVEAVAKAVGGAGGNGGGAEASVNIVGADTNANVSGVAYASSGKPTSTVPRTGNPEFQSSIVAKVDIAAQPGTQSYAETAAHNEGNGIAKPSALTSIQADGPVQSQSVANIGGNDLQRSFLDAAGVGNFTSAWASPVVPGVLALGRGVAYDSYTDSMTGVATFTNKQVFVINDRMVDPHRLRFSVADLQAVCTGTCSYAVKATQERLQIGNDSFSVMSFQDIVTGDTAGSSFFADIRLQYADTGVYTHFNMSFQSADQINRYFSTNPVLSEPVPEPAEWVLLMAGFGLVRWRVRRRLAGRSWV